jgi:hypothetical protein
VSWGRRRSNCKRYSDEGETVSARTEKTKEAFLSATSAKKYKDALREARRLKGKDQLVVLDALFAAADRLGVRRSTGEPLGMTQQIDGSVTVTWETKTCRPDGSTARVVSTAVLEPTDFGAGWKSRTKDVPEEIVEAVTAAAMADELVAPLAKKRRRIYVR